MRRGLLLLLVLLLAACGGGKHAATTTVASVPTPGPGTVLYSNPPWAVVLDGDKATALHLVHNTWVPDTSGKVKITVLGPKGVARPTPQVAAELSAKAPLVESALWGDGVELLVEELLLRGELVRLLEGEVGTTATLAVVYPERKLVRPVVRAFVDALVNFGKAELTRTPKCPPDDRTTSPRTRSGSRAGARTSP